MKFLVVDDFSTMRRIVSGILKECGITNIKEADDGDNALVMLKNEKFDFLIQDMFLPINSDGRIDNKGGIYVLEQMKYRDIDVKTCVCSSDSVSYKYMVDRNFRNTPFVDFSSFQFRNDLIEFLKS